MRRAPIFFLGPIFLSIACGMGDAELGSGPDDGSNGGSTTDSGTTRMDASAGSSSEAAIASDAAADSLGVGDGAMSAQDAATLTPAAVVLFGGIDGTEVLGDTWEWNGTNWTTFDGGVGPSPRTGAAIASFGDKVVLWGGSDGLGPLNDMWGWDGATWTEITSAPGLNWLPGSFMAGFEGSLFAYQVSTGAGETSGNLLEFDGTEWSIENDGSLIPEWQGGGPWGMASVPNEPGPCTTDCPNQLLVLFGAGSSTNQTWASDGGALAQIDVGASTSNAYPPPGQGVLAGLTDSLLLVQTASSLGTTTTWQWSAGAWVQLQVTTPTFANATMASLGESAVLFAGVAQQTWIWNANGWSQASPTTSPPGNRTGQAMATRFAP